MWHLSLTMNLLCLLLNHHPLSGFTWWSQVTEIHVQQQYLWHVMYYQCQLNQSWLIPLIPYICQLLYSHISHFYPGLIFLSVIQHAYDINSNILIKYFSITKRPYIVIHRFGLSQPYFHSLYGTGLARNYEQTRRSLHYIRRGFFIL